MIKRYEHTQAGYFIAIAVVAAMVAIGINMARTGVNWIAATVLVVLAVIVFLFSRLTVVINEEDEVAVRGMMTMTLSADHRVIDGVTGAKFLSDLVQAVETPDLLLY